MRKTYPDYMKAFGAILVILAHSISTYSESFKLVPRPLGIVGNLCYAVNASVFFVIAGYFCHKQEKLRFYWKKTKTILLPFAVFSLLKIFYTLIFSSRFAHSDTPAGIFKDAFLYGRLYWFPYTLFIIFLLAPLFWHGKEKDCLRLTLSAAVMIVFCIINEYLSLSGKENSVLLLQLNNVCKYLPFFLMGIIFGHLSETDLSKVLTKHMRIKLVLSSALVVFFGYLLVRGLPAGDEVRVMWEQPYHIRVLTALPLIYVIYGVSKLLPEKISLLSLMGQRSLQILLFDSIFRTIIYSLLARFFEPHFWMIAAESVLSIALTLICCEIIKRIPFIRTLVGL